MEGALNSNILENEAAWCELQVPSKQQFFFYNYKSM